MACASFRNLPAVSSHARVMEVIVRPLRETDLAVADRICRVAFGTFVGMADPARFMGDADYVHFPMTAWLGEAFTGVSVGSLENAIVVVAAVKILISFAWMVVQRGVGISRTRA